MQIGFDFIILPKDMYQIVRGYYFCYGGLPFVPSLALGMMLITFVFQPIGVWDISRTKTI